MASNAAMGMHTSGGTGCKRGGIAETDTDNGEAEVSEIIERAAKALENLDSSDFHERQTKDYTEMARAVLMAIREPSDEIITAGLDKAGIDGEVYHLEDFRLFVTGMIDVAVQEG